MAILFMTLNANAQLPLPPLPDSATPPFRNIQAEVAQLTQRYGLSEDQAAKVRSILNEESQKVEEVLKDGSLPPQDRLSKLQSVRKEEISRVSDALTPEQKKKYEADVQSILPGQNPAAGTTPAVPNS